MSVGVSLFGAGLSFVSFEALGRNEPAKKKTPVRLVSTYGILTALLRTSQTAALTFTVASLACALKGVAAVGVALSVIVYVGLGFEAMTRDTERDEAWGGGIEAFGGRLASLCGVSGYRTRKGAVVWGLLHAVLVGGMAACFWLLPHVANNCPPPTHYHSIAFACHQSLIGVCCGQMRMTASSRRQTPPRRSTSTARTATLHSTQPRPPTSLASCCCRSRWLWTRATPG